MWQMTKTESKKVRCLCCRMGTSVALTFIITMRLLFPRMVLNMLLAQNKNEPIGLMKFKRKNIWREKKKGPARLNYADARKAPSIGHFFGALTKSLYFTSAPFYFRCALFLAMA